MSTDMPIGGSTPPLSDNANALLGGGGPSFDSTNIPSKFDSNIPAFPPSTEDRLYRAPEDDECAVTRTAPAEASTPKESVKADGKYPVTTDGSLTKEEVIQYLKASPEMLKLATEMGVGNIEEAVDLVNKFKKGTRETLSLSIDKKSAIFAFDMLKTHLEKWKDDDGYTVNRTVMVQDINGGYVKRSLQGVRRVTVDGQKMYLDKDGNYYDLFLSKVDK